MLIILLIGIFCACSSYCAHLEFYKQWLNGKKFLEIVLFDKAMFFDLLDKHPLQCKSILLLDGIMLEKGVVHEDLTAGEKKQIVSAYKRFDIYRYFEKFKNDIYDFLVNFFILDPLPSKLSRDDDGHWLMHNFRILKRIRSMHFALKYLSNLQDQDFDVLINQCIGGKLLRLTDIKRNYIWGCLNGLERFYKREKHRKLFRMLRGHYSSLNKKLSALRKVKKEHLRVTSELGSDRSAFLQACIDAKVSAITNQITGYYAKKKHFSILAKLTDAQLCNLVHIPVSDDGIIVARYWYIQASFHPSMKSPALARYITYYLSSFGDKYFRVTAMIRPLSPPLGTIADSTDLNSGSSSSSNSSSNATVPTLPDDLLFKIFSFVNEGNFFQLHFVFKNVCKHWSDICSLGSGNYLGFQSAFEMLKHDARYSNVDKLLTIYPWNVVFKSREQYCLFLSWFILNPQVSGTLLTLPDLVKSFSENQDLLDPPLLATIYCKLQDDRPSLLFPAYFTDAQIVETLKIIAIDNNMEIRLSREDAFIWDMLEKRNVFDILMSDREKGLKVLDKLVDKKGYWIDLVATTNPGKHPLEFLSCIFDKPIQSTDEIEGRLIEIVAKNGSSIYLSSIRPIGSIKLLIEALKRGCGPVLHPFEASDCVELFRAVFAAKVSAQEFELICDWLSQSIKNPERILATLCDVAFSLEEDKILIPCDGW